MYIICFNLENIVKQLAYRKRCHASFEVAFEYIELPHGLNFRYDSIKSINEVIYLQCSLLDISDPNSAVDESLVPAWF